MSRFCIADRAPFGSLLKQPNAKKRKPVKLARSRDNMHLAAVRRLPCLSCNRDPGGVAAHVRMSAPGKPNAGVGCKPDDWWALPLCDNCHTRGPTAQHNVGEPTFWRRLGIDPLALCAAIYAVSPDVPKMRDAISKATGTQK